MAGNNSYNGKNDISSRRAGSESCQAKGESSASQRVNKNKRNPYYNQASSAPLRLGPIRQASPVSNENYKLDQKAGKAKAHHSKCQVMTLCEYSQERGRRHRSKIFVYDTVARERKHQSMYRKRYVPWKTELKEQMATSPRWDNVIQAPKLIRKHSATSSERDT
ncbi:hypothetical protein BO86DRAFT_25442 [Aspergillus japonicus CBS 114.51]|uniref:Uncharacterized protein n=1 Tax=Aspergillus japonicus CBS 114.51 TaxID=1448312 RepID=A0A8T8X7L0_ASPJA|nr:hypothetical protein BO86DRAFT_25442 [Aspergillus japonicus CBS 114.51]RAH83995.1 hypothetical protein BO86DRAFT_25442 [Aspergillus japonicus CBS 114.51]